MKYNYVTTIAPTILCTLELIYTVIIARNMLDFYETQKYMSYHNTRMGKLVII